jgi:hypothetical protein
VVNEFKIYTEGHSFQQRQSTFEDGFVWLPTGINVGDILVEKDRDKITTINKLVEDIIEKEWGRFAKSDNDLIKPIFEMGGMMVHSAFEMPVLYIVTYKRI